MISLFTLVSSRDTLPLNCFLTPILFAGVDPALVEAIWAEAARLFFQLGEANLASSLCQNMADKGQDLVHQFSNM